MSTDRMILEIERELFISRMVEHGSEAEVIRVMNVRCRSIDQYIERIKRCRQFVASEKRIRALKLSCGMTP